MLNKTTVLLILIIIFGALLRLYNLNWDSGFHLHPDERMITMVADKITLENPNPDFFAYGSFPIYLLKAFGIFVGLFDSQFSNYQSINLVGRFLSALFDLGTLIILYFLGKKLFDKNVGLLSAFFYAIAVLPIQLSHFYAVDTPLTFFIILTLYCLILYTEKHNSKYLILTSISFGLALATKASAILLIVPIILTLILASQARLGSINKSIFCGSFMAIFTLISFFIFEPFAFLDFQNFWQQTLTQQAMTKSAFTFPYTLQYVGKIPYLYEIQNIFFWGLGPVLATLALIGTIFFTFKTFRPILNSKFLILTSFFWLYFAIVGHFAIGFMRYMLPLYPLLCLFAAILFWQIILFIKPRISHLLFLILYSLFFILLLIWPLSFISIYSQPNTRVSASEWIYQNIPANSLIAREHWDDGLPLANRSNYQFLDLPMYDSDLDPLKWEKVNQVLQTTDYIIIASNRLYTPLQKMINCPNLPVDRCYTKTADYYQKLFSGQLGFKKVAEFSVYPSFKILNFKFKINDSSSDESFTVYDHPKIMIFAKTSVILWQP
ncbi:MAG: glycosyltransferase family 39 protein [Candidatus Daviesbacteria bacterium]|nr:glycosyltransferase family 39 protein [Candidatus Daviesbacteria bacterium]